MSSSSSSSSRSRARRDRSQARNRNDAQLLENIFLAAQQQQQQSDLLGRIPPLPSEPPNPPPLPDNTYHPASSSMRQRFKTVLTAPGLAVDLEAANIPPPPPPQPNIGVQVDLEAANIPPPPQPNIGVQVDLEAGNIPQPVEPAAPPIPHPIEAGHIVLIPNHNLVDRIRIVITGLFTRGRVYVAGLFTRGRLLVAGLFTRVGILVAGLFTRIGILVKNRLKVFFGYLAARPFIRYLLKRNDEFRSGDEPNEKKPRLVSFQSNSTPRNDKFWRFFKWVYIVNAWLMILCLFAGVCYWKFGEGSGNPKSLRFKDKAMINPVLAGGLVSTVVFGSWACQRWNDLKLFKIRCFHIGFLAFDVICDFRSIKAVALTFYGFYDVANKHGVWTDFFLVGFPVFYSIGSLSILILFQHEFYHAHGLINDFIVIFVGPMIIQFAHGSNLNGVLYSIPIVFGRLSKLLGYIYRPHVTDEFYDPTTTPI